jgi:hypothetical protein
MPDKESRRFEDIETEAEDTNIEVWRVDSLTHAAPLVTMDQYQKIIADGYMDEPRIIIEGLVNAYALKHKSVIEELLSASHCH